MNDILTAATPLVVLLLGYLTTLVRSFIKAKTAPNQFAAISGVAQTIVAGIDQLDRHKKMTNEQRYALASKTLAQSAKKVGVKLSDEEASAFIHAAVLLAHQV